MIAGALLAATLAPAAVLGQEASPLSVSVGAAATLAVGDESDFLDGGIGPWAGLTWAPPSSSHFRLGLDAAWIPFADDRDGLTGARADNVVLTVFLRPELYAEAGPLRPFVALEAGAALAHWRLQDASGSRSGWESAGAWGGGAGLDVQVAGGRHAVSLRAGGWIADLGELALGRAPDPASSTNAPGTVAVNMALLSLRLGVQIAM